jgi:ABC-type nitrate/sulfonate/bicarbonate transport system substrate-binding protein
MTRRKPGVLRILKRSKPLLVGFMPEADCAPIVVAQELGLYKKYGLAVELRREQSWRNIQDKIISRQLQAAHAPATLPFLINLGLAPEKCACVTGLVLSLQGNTITISRDLWNRGVTDAESLGRHIMRDKRIYTFGVNCPLGPQYWLLCQWLRSAEIPYHVKVRIEPAAATQMFPLLKMGYLDGYCVGEPWSSLAVQAGVGVCLTTSAQLAPFHPEKVLLVRKDFAEQQREEHERLIAALIEACAFCDQPENRSRLCDLLVLPQYVNVPVECLEASLLDSRSSPDGPIRALHGSNIFHRNGANDPTAAKAAWVTGKLYEFLRWNARPAALNHVFQRSIFLRAHAMTTRRRLNPSSRPKVADRRICGASMT